MAFQQLKSSIPGFIPLIILIVAEWVWGMVIGLWLAVAYGIGEMAYFAIRYQRFEKRTFWDTGLLVVLGLVALALEGPLLDRIRPLIYLTIMLLMVGISAFSKHNLLMAASGRFLKNRSLGPWEMAQMRMTMQHFFWWMAGYWLILLAALWMPVSWEAFLNSSGLYLFIVLAMGTELLIKRSKNKRWSEEEWLPLVEKDGKVMGSAPRSVVHNGHSRWLHPVVHIQLIMEGGLWLQKRPMHKQVQPGKWDTAVGGHVAANETVERSLQREAAEEIGVHVKEVHHLGRYHWESPLENELVLAFSLRYNGEITPHPHELDGGRVWSFDEIDDNLGQGIFTPNFEHEYLLYKDSLRQ
ncbi:NUDIX hydrolase [Geofilum rubicundum]|uniref:Putative Nudix hydrolase YfcD n=1 Tax=Geofilum rubicundum JCM 15548 TaxID=1236989 RepID=A0A0E9LTT9_9BACT|nr:NUDIX domain-containing protein [Geofilum rubicundum]GAO28713.1 putative Nudix hydrolase YfcD [Geofilum rubicundum JCM 15548]